MHVVKDSALIISATAPVPVDNGKRAVLNGLLTYFVERLGPDNVHYAVLVADDEELPPIPGVVHRLPRPGIGGQVAAMRHWVTNRSYTLQEAMLGSATLHAEIGALLDRIQPCQSSCRGSPSSGLHTPAPLRTRPYPAQGGAGRPRLRRQPARELARGG